MTSEAHDADGQTGAGDPSRQSVETNRTGGERNQAADPTAEDSLDASDAPRHDAADHATPADLDTDHDGRSPDGRVSPEDSIENYTFASRVGGRLGIGRDRRASLALSVRRDNPLTTAIRATCFWMAIALPFLYLPLLIAGVETRPEGLALLALLALNALSLLIGHSHRGE